MEESPSTPVISQKIFQLGLAVESVSLYLLCVSLAGMPKALSVANIQEIWNGTEAQLTRALEDLQQHNILQPSPVAATQTPVYRLIEADKWQE